MAVSKRTGRKSLAANDFLIPLPPGPPVANDVGTNRAFDNGAAVVDFSSVQNAVSYKIYASSQGQDTVVATGVSSPIVVTGLKSNVLYTFTAAGINSQGQESAQSDPSTPTLITSVPATPAAPTASSPNAGSDIISWTAPNSGGKTISGYIWAASDGKTNATGGNPGGGPTTNTSVTVSQEQGTAQTYTVYAINPNGQSLTSAPSNSVTTTFSFAPFGFTPFGFTPFGFTPFGFTPFAFTPFSFTPMFSFTPPFSFTPMFTFTPAFSFTPMFSFSPAFSFAPMFSFAPAPPMCIGEDTEIACVADTGETIFVAAKNLKIGDRVISPIWSEYESGELIDHEHDKVSYDKLTNLSYNVVSVKDISSKIVTETLVFNDDFSKHLSTVQPILAKKQGSDSFAWEITRDIEVGDIIMHYDGVSKEYSEVLVTNVTLNTQEKQTVYRITPEEYLTFVAGQIVCC